MIDQAFANQDKETVVEAYLDTLDYAKELNDSAFVKVLESVSFEEAIDHVLYGHVKEQMDARSLDSRMYMSVYYLNVKGGLTAADLLNEIAQDRTVTKVDNSELFKTELVDKVFSDEAPMDSFVREKLQHAIKALEHKLDKEFYGIEEPVPEPEAEEAAEAETPEAPATEEAVKEETTSA